MIKDKRKYADRAQYLKNAVAKRRKIIRQKAIEHKGRKCAICGYNKCNKTLEFHHINLDSKNFGISAKGYTRSWLKVKQEVDRCILFMCKLSQRSA
ncbi:hypothetical protein KKD03_00510 [Patescibacteria group bacterium]|nr:hypothetical protein [Patescibacteria group bacterium]